MQECQDACTADTNCLSLDFGRSKCWLHSNANYANSRFSDNSVTQYVKVDCSTATPTGTATGTATGTGTGQGT